MTALQNCRNSRWIWPLTPLSTSEIFCTRRPQPPHPSGGKLSVPNLDADWLMGEGNMTTAVQPSRKRRSQADISEANPSYWFFPPVTLQFSGRFGKRPQTDNHSQAGATSNNDIHIM